ncbi:MAG: hypothetical protein KDJ52_13515 [Anaerolineae bacterium]|nr:hypothetical protein [Anaerolineae bacterium]
MMQINWTLLTYIIIIFFSIVGFSRGWWREAIFTVFFGILILLLQNPDWAQTIITFVNDIIASVWSYIPTGITNVVNNGLTNFFAITTRSDTPFQLDPTAPETWLSILLIGMLSAYLIGQIGFTYNPTGFGKLLGLGMGALNGYLLLSIAREYLDGRALPGQGTAAAAASSEVSLVGSSSFGPPVSTVTIQAVNLPEITLMDSIIPWIAIAIGGLFLFTLINTRFRLLSSNDGRKIEARVPPFHK